MDLDLAAGVNDAWAAVVLIVPRLLAFLVILLVGIVVAKLMEKLVNTVLERVGFDRLVERGGVGRAMEHTRWDASDIIAKIVSYAILLVTLLIAFNVFGPNPVSTLLAGIVAWLPQLFVAIVIIVVAAAIANGVRDIIRGTLGGLSYGNAIATGAFVVILALGVIAALNQIGVAVTITLPILIAVLATVAGVIIVGVGGGLVRPMQARWERMLNTAETETGRVREQVRMRREPVTPRTEPLDQRVFDRPYASESTTERRRPPGGVA